MVCLLYTSMPVEISPDIYQDRKGIFWLLGVTGGVIRLDCTTDDIILLSYPKLKEVPFTKPCTFIHEDEYLSLIHIYLLDKWQAYK